MKRETRAEKPILVPAVARAVVVALTLGAAGCGGSSTEAPVPPAVVATPVFDVAGGTYSADQQVSLSTATAGAVIHYTTDGTTPSAASPALGAPIAVAGHGTTVTIRAIATKAGMSDSPVASATYSIVYETVTAPVFDVAAGTYDADQQVSLSTSTAGAVIRYTTDGTTPSGASPVLGGPIAIAGHGTTVTIRAIATKAGMNDSAVASATYSIEYGTVAAPVATPASGTVASIARVTFTSGTAGVTFRSTTDGATEPTCAGVGVEGANVPVAASVWVVACKSGMLPSPVLKLSFDVVTYNLVFATSTTYTGGLGGLAGADAACAARAAAAGLSGTYAAYLSTSGVDAISRLAGKRGWVRMDGRPFADTTADIAAGKILYPPRFDELGAELVPSPSAIAVMTGTLADGTKDSAQTCSDWTVASGFVRTGLSEGGTMWWSSGGSGGCSDAKRLYCFGVDHSNPLALPAATGRLAFLTSSVSFDPGSGLAAADAICAAEASASSLAGTYKALLATDGASAASRFATSGGTWVRTDGVQLVATAADLSVPPMMAPLDVGAGATHLTPNQVWIGAADFGTPGTAATTCNGWSTSAGGASVTGGSTGLSRHAGWFTLTCDTFARLYCLQE